MVPPTPVKSVDIAVPDDSFAFWGFTAVIYTRGDPLSFFLGIVSLLPLMSIIMLFTVGFFRPKKWLAFLLTGMALNFMLSGILKEYVFRQHRPVHPWSLAGRRDYGMPSSHSQFMSFLWGAAIFSAIDYAKEQRWLKGVGAAAEEKGGKDSAAADVKAEAVVLNSSAAVSRRWDGVAAAASASSAAVTANAAGISTSTGPSTTFSANSVHTSRKARYTSMKLYKARNGSELMARRHALRIVALLFLTFLVMYSRVYNVFHTTEQVWAGFGCGLIASFVLYRVPSVYLAIEALSDHTLLKLLRLGHSVLVAVA